MPARWNWPAFRCVAVDRASGNVCQARATWRAKPIARSRTWWPYCDRCRPEGAEPIPLDVPMHVTRVTLTVAIASMLPGAREASEEAAAAVAHALETVGAQLLQLRVHGVGQKPGRAKPHGLRILLAGPVERPARGPFPVAEREKAPSWWDNVPKQVAVARIRPSGRRSTAGEGQGPPDALPRPRAAKARLNGQRRKASGE
jgi:hypothetical protein